MEWVETTARTREEATELALDQLGVVLEEAEVVVLEEPRPGLFGRMRGEARIRARVRPAPVRPKQERRRGSRNRAAPDRQPRTEETASVAADEPVAAGAEETSGRRRRGGGRGRGGRQGSGQRTDGSPSGANADGEPASPSPVAKRSPSPEGAEMTTDVPAADDAEPTVSVDEVRDAAVQFVHGLTDAFGLEAAVGARIEGSEIEVDVTGESLGLLIGPGGRTLLGIQDLARVAAQRRLGDHDTRLRVDVAGYREKRRQALERFARTVAEQVKESGVARSLDPMPSADRKVLHDALAEIDGVVSRSEGEEPHRRVIVAPS
jgi:spoIIIJ-associated protein